MIHEAIDSTKNRNVVLQSMYSLPTLTGLDKMLAMLPWFMVVLWIVAVAIYTGLILEPNRKRCEIPKMKGFALTSEVG